ncbi:hypothetical protein [Flavobacterium flavigenum]|jgi:hypothetical protein|uniref:hypothetical protein n=1 Tax=Flavobacterium flavigenum TaxID=3003258 RepID=UPI0024822577|nr:hypothetical protein [Flavobacterium flavigenum]
MLKAELDTIIKSFPLIFIILTTLGYIHLQSYYYFFDIEIINYLEISEIPLLFFNKAILIILLILIIITISYFVDDKISKEENEIENYNLERLKHEISKPKNFINNNLGWIIIFFLIIYVIIALIFKNYIGLIYPIAYIICAIIYILSEKTILKTLVKNHNTFSSFIIYIGFIALILFNLSTISNSIEKGYKLRYENEQSKLIFFTYGEKVIETNNKLIYIGETKKNLFLFDKEKDETLIFKMDKIDNFKFRQR